MEQRYGRWVVTGELDMRDPGHRVAPAGATAGPSGDVLAFALRQRQDAKLRVPQARAGGHAGRPDALGRRRTVAANDPLYRLWIRIKRRCYDTKAHNYRWYGAVGVTMWEPWLNDAGAFIAYIEAELGPRPSPKHSIDRIDPFGNYEPGKLRWATPVEQARNTRRRALAG